MSPGEPAGPPTGPGPGSNPGTDSADAAGIAGRLAQIQSRIAAACQRAGRSPSDVLLIGVSKTHPAPALEAAFRAGLRSFGENRVQEAAGKAPGLTHLEIDWHLIGPLQTNKVKAALDVFRTVHSVDRPRIAEALEREAAARGLRIPALLEINLGGEESKHGFSPEDLAETVRPLAAYEHLRISGLMAIPPPGASPEDSRPWFQRLRALRDDLAGRPEWTGFPGWLSMGMSDDFEVAVEEGATHVRVGTALFGRRG